MATLSKLPAAHLTSCLAARERRHRRGVKLRPRRRRTSLRRLPPSASSKPTALPPVKLYDAEPTVLRALAARTSRSSSTSPTRTSPPPPATRLRPLVGPGATSPPTSPPTQIQTVAVGNEALSSTPPVKVSSPDRPQRPPVLLPIVRRLVQARPREGVIEADARASSVQTGSYLHGSTPTRFFRLRGQRRRHLPRLRPLPAEPGVADAGNGLKYYSLLDASSTRSSPRCRALKYDDIKIVVSETGWPSKGDRNETAPARPTPPPTTATSCAGSSPATPAPPSVPTPTSTSTSSPSSTRTRSRGRRRRETTGCSYPSEEKCTTST
ncbi:uncharacterized protein A4U43_C08F7580 [Asparagus officinalis]|nr:uncharacterized protein A4U43_C08F7580 [Asparagus officinalis]